MNLGWPVQFKMEKLGFFQYSINALFNGITYNIAVLYKTKLSISSTHSGSSSISSTKQRFLYIRLNAGIIDLSAFMMGFGLSTLLVMKRIYCQSTLIKFFHPLYPTLCLNPKYLLYTDQSTTFVVEYTLLLQQGEFYIFIFLSRKVSKYSSIEALIKHSKNLEKHKS